MRNSLFATFVRVTLISFCVIFSYPASGEPIMQGLKDQATCNQEGFYYDHSKDTCTDIKVLACNNKMLADLVKAEAANAAEWTKMHAKITNLGYKPSQCMRKKDQEIVINYVKEGLWPEFKTVRVLTH